MINTKRVVPITRVDLLTFIGLIMKLMSISYTVLQSKNITGDYDVSAEGAAGTLLADQPVKSLDFKADVTSGTVYFVADYQFKGITVAGSPASITEGSAEICPDASTFYKAELSSGAVTVTAISPIVA